MADFKIMVRTKCKSCGNMFRSSIPDEINVKPENMLNIKITIEELKSNVSKPVYDLNHNPIGTYEMKDFKFKIDHSCGNTNSYSVNDFEFLPV